MLMHCPLCKVPITPNVRHTCQTKSGGKCTVYVGHINIGVTTKKPRKKTHATK